MTTDRQPGRATAAECEQWWNQLSGATRSALSQAPDQPLSSDLADDVLSAGASVGGNWLNSPEGSKGQLLNSEVVDWIRSTKTG